MGGGDEPAKIDPEERDAMVAFARCMREHGIGMPDPTGGLVMRKDDDRGPDRPRNNSRQPRRPATTTWPPSAGKAGSEERS